MNKANLLLGAIILSAGMNSFAADPIPDPTVQIATPPAGLPGSNPNNAPIVAPAPINELAIQGIFIAENKAKEGNKVFINNGFYKVGDVVSDIWKVKSITRKQVVLVNIETKQIKNLYISGE